MSLIVLNNYEKLWSLMNVYEWFIWICIIMNDYDRSLVINIMREWKWMIVNDYDRLREIMTHFAENAIDPEGSYNPQKVRKGS